MHTYIKSEALVLTVSLDLMNTNKISICSAYNFKEVIRTLNIHNDTVPYADLCIPLPQQIVCKLTMQT